MNRKSKVPQLRFPEFTDDWEQRKLGDIGLARSGVGFPDAEQGGTEGIPFFKVSDMNNVGNENELVSANNYVSDEQIKRKRWNVITDVPAIFFAKVGAAVMLNRKRLVRFPFLLDNNTMAYIFDKKTWDCEFGKTLFETIDLTKLTQTGALPSYNASDVENIEIYLPNIEEQKAIGAFFLQLDNLITLHQRKLDNLNSIKKSMLGKLFPKKGEKYPEVRFKGFTGEWEQRKLSDVVDVLDGDRGKNYPTDRDFSDSGHTMFLNASNVTVDGFSFEDTQYISEEKSNSMGNGKLQKDDIVVTSRGSLGHIAWYNAGIVRAVPYARINSGMLLLRKKLDDIQTPYLYQFMKSHKGQEQISFISFGSAQPQLTKKGVENLEIILPRDVDEQNKIAKLFCDIDNLITLHQRKLDNLNNIKKGFLQQMFV